MKKLLCELRCLIGEKLLYWAICVMPVESRIGQAVCRGLVENREYERYAAYCKTVGAEPRSFEEWLTFIRPGVIRQRRRAVEA